MDPVSLALGIAPLCVAALKGSRALKTKIKQLRNHDREISRFRKHLKNQTSIFQDESHILLQNAGIDPDLVREMMDDFNHEDWTSADVDSQIRSFLGEKYDEVQETSRQVNAQFLELESKLECFEEESRKRGKLSETARRAQNAVGLVLSKSSLEEGIELLRDSVAEFRRLRKVAKDLAGPGPQGLAVKRRKAMPRTLILIAKHSNSFIESFSRTWRCLNSDGTHSTHRAKLFLDPDASDDCVNFRMILEYEATTGSLKQQSLLFLRIKSEELSWAEDIPPPVPEPSRESARPAKARRVRFLDSPAQSSRAERCLPQPECSGKTDSLTHDLCKAKDVCQHVFEQGKAFHQSKREGCIGYLVSSDNLTHQLMAAQDRESTAIQTHSYAVTSLASIVQPSKEMEVTVHDQLRLAFRIAQSVLQYHSTPWWRRNWRLSDLSYFDIDTELSSSLATLHIDASLVPRTERLGLQAALPAVSDDEAEAEMFCGIRNVTLHSLGVALLQIGRWEELDAGDVVQVRRAAEKPSPLGTRYDELTMRCLYCDFGLGADLNKQDLQAAIYENVVCELEEMARAMERLE
ncbi:hypothetical protein QBC47DRAFT_325149 [Echria macrotheca]|uniref:DUF7580 domain-containing protein n=1 Tax=Echria macrotheca TaxID=438768 RepID=A0AAJ0F513_9PEZI|nr:hypothetical protein QBC47DRAFT_325149 [Echria macrotheca]